VKIKEKGMSGLSARQVIIIKGYSDLIKFKTFDMDRVYALTGNKNTASSLVLRLSKKGLVKKIKNNLYSCVDLATGEIIADRFQIACAIDRSAYISYHSVFEYTKLTNNKIDRIYISCNKRFADFEFEGTRYIYVTSPFEKGVVASRQNEGIRLTTVERSIVDGIKDPDKMGGLEELLRCLSGVVYCDDAKIVEYLEEYDIRFLYQKTGYILSRFKDKLKISGYFFDHCKEKAGKSTRYLSKDANRYCSDWKLVVPDWFL
jgi:predicted transcriptional regulator of viral defense system